MIFFRICDTAIHFKIWSVQKMCTENLGMLIIDMLIQDSNLKALKNDISKMMKTPGPRCQQSRLRLHHTSNSSSDLPRTSHTLWACFLGQCLHSRYGPTSFLTYLMLSANFRNLVSLLRSRVCDLTVMKCILYNPNPPASRPDDPQKGKYICVNSSIHSLLQ